MKFFTFTFLAICLLSFSVFGQDETVKITEPSKYQEIEHRDKRGSEDLKMAFWTLRDSFLAQNPKNSGLIINYGNNTDKTARIAEIKRTMAFLGLDEARVSFVDGGRFPFAFTEFWMIPENSFPPKPEKTAEFVDETGAISEKKLEAKYNRFCRKIEENENTVGYIVSFGKWNTKEKRNSLLLKIQERSDCKTSRIEIVQGVFSKSLTTQFWIVTTKKEQNGK
jgi:hypothetical protein